MAESENLDARMELIRLKNEELEKKHKEIMEDEKMAKLNNAVIDVKGRDIEAPTAHPYDNIDLDFDVKDTDKELAKKNDDFQPKSESCYFLFLMFSSYLHQIFDRSKTASTKRFAR
jgi:hypothetical protein